jgi:hypothetical protein
MRLYLDDLTNQQCISFPKLFFFNQSEIVSILESKHLFFSEYYDCIEEATQIEN